MKMAVRPQLPPADGEKHFGAEKWEKLLLFADLLAQEGERRGLLGPREMGKLWDRHLLNSLAIDGFLFGGCTLADIGAGAGFPGLVIAIVRPDTEVSLIETMERRCEWLNLVSDRLKLDNVRVLNARAEELKKKVRVDFVTARAVASLKKLIPLTIPLLKEEGSLLAIKGARAEEEVKEASVLLQKFRAKWVDVYDVPVWGAAEGTRVLRVKI